MNRFNFLGMLLFCTLLCGCASSASPDVTGTGSQLESRQLQTREYDTLDMALTMRSVLATLQDLDFTIDTADLDLGTITATRVYNSKDFQQYTMRMTVTVRQMSSGRVSVRANARLGDAAISDPKTYQDFFSALDKSMFLTLHGVD